MIDKKNEKNQKKEKNLRKEAYLILMEYEKEGAYLNLLLKNKLSDISLNSAFVTELVYGVVRYKRFLDYKIEKYSSIKLKKISLSVLVILRMGFYQLYFMDSVPDFALINESVKLCEKVQYKSKGYVNAILRKGVSEKDIEDKNEKKISWEIKYSFSDDMFSQIKAQYKEKTETILKNLNEKKPVSIRINELKTDKTKFLSLINNENIYEKNGFFFLKGSIDKELYDKGFYTVQSISSQMCVNVLNPKENENIIDMCCAPGGKTAYIAEIMKNTGKITAFEFYEHRAELTKKNLERLSVSNTTVITADATEYNNNFKDTFDKILCDVPCSGWGVIGGKPDIKWHNEDISELIKIQKKILLNASRYVKKNGIIVYSTCTINKNENEILINEFLNENKNFELSEFSVISDDGEIKSDGMLPILPDETKIGFFIAKLHRKE